MWNSLYVSAINYRYTMRQTLKSHIQFIQLWDKVTHTAKQKIADSTEGYSTSPNGDSLSGCTQSGTWQFLKWYSWSPSAGINSSPNYLKSIITRKGELPTKKDTYKNTNYALKHSTMGLHSMFTEGQWNHMVWLFWEILYLYGALEHHE